MKQYFILSLLFMLQGYVNAQEIWTNEINSSSPGLVNPYITGQVHSPNITVSGIGHSNAVGGAAGDNLYNTNLWSTDTAIDETRYIYFTITPNEGYKLNITRLTYNAQRSPNGPRFFAFRSSVDEFAGNIGDPTATGAIIDLTPFQHITTPVTFRLYAYGATDLLGSFGIEDFRFEGDAVLPVTFGEISAVYNGQQIKVNWTTMYESNNDHFNIEASTDGSHFKSIYTIRSRAENGNSSVRLNYSMEAPFDKQAFGSLSMLIVVAAFFRFGRKKLIAVLCGVLFFFTVLASCTRSASEAWLTESKSLFIRISQVDKDGASRYSKTIRVVNSKE